MKKFILTLIATSILALTACSNNNLKKGSYKNLSYGKPLEAVDSQTIRTNLRNTFGTYSKFSISYYMKNSQNNNESESYTVLSGSMNTDGSVSYVIKTSTKSNNSGVTVQYKTVLEHLLTSSGSFIIDSFLSSDGSGRKEIQYPTTVQPSVFAIQTYWNNGSFSELVSEYANDSIYKTDKGIEIVRSNIDENHQFQSYGNNSFEAIAIMRNQRIISASIEEDKNYITKATYYQDVRRNYDESTGKHFKSLKETRRVYLEISFTR